MTYILTLIADQRSNADLDGIARLLCNELGPALVAPQPLWLSPGEACDLAIGDVPVAAMEAAVQQAIDGAAIDFAILPEAGRRKKMLIADMDSTIIEQECLDEIAEMAGIGAEIAAITERAMRGELEFETALKERIALLEGFPVAKLQTVLDERIRLTRGARVLTHTMARHGGRSVLVSGGFTFFTGAVAGRAGFDAHFGNEFVVEDGRIMGVREPILGRSAKLETMQAEAARLGLPLSGVIAVGDGANDLAMLKAAGLGVAFHAKPLVAAEAAARVNYNDLTALLFLQGYSRADFTEA